MRDVITICLAALLLGGAARAADTSDSRALDVFDKVEASRGVKVELVCGAESVAVVSGPSADVADTRTVVSNRTLKIERAASFFKTVKSDVRVRVTAPVPLISIAVSTGADLSAQPCTLSSDHLDLTASTGAALTLAAKVNRLSLGASTGSAIRPLPGGRIDGEDVVARASTGADVRLCKVAHLQGRATLGAAIKIEDSGTNELGAILGADVVRQPCT